ncbi:MAG: class I SAM-dependent methyltransferase [candidate division KSB1 bacterium]|nr:class I SAM-dependent methyltransferase [candidate division KSB1 bacterium]
MSKSRSLSEISHKLARSPNIIQSTLSELLAPERNLKVLEVGFGHGRALMELAWRFRNENVAFYGVDKKQKPPVEKREDLCNIARLYNIIPESELAYFQLPELFFYDATTLHFDDDSLDLIYSAVTIRFIEKKAEFLEEACRVLKPGGVAMLHIGERRWNYPYSLIGDHRLLTPYASRFILKHGNELIPLPVYMKLFEQEEFQFDFIGGTRCTIRIRKLRPARLHLQLEFNPELSVSMQELPYRHRMGNVRGGVRSVYEVNPEVYRALFEKGLLTREQLRTDLPLPEEYQIDDEET